MSQLAPKKKLTLSFKKRKDICEVLADGGRCGYIVSTPKQGGVQFNITLAFKTVPTVESPHGWEWRTFEVVNDSLADAQAWLRGKWPSLISGHAGYEVHVLCGLDTIIAPFEVATGSVH